MPHCPSGKTSYQSRSLAEDALIDSWIRHNYSPGNGPSDVYSCEDCGEFHFTSKGNMNARLKAAWADGSISKNRRGFQLEDKLRRRG